MPVWGEKPPIPTSDESEYVMMVGFRKTILLIEMPAFAEFKNLSHRVRSLRVWRVSSTRRFFFLLLIMLSVGCS